MKIIDLEAHFYTREYIDYLCSRKEFPREERGEEGIKLWYTDTFRPAFPLSLLLRFGLDSH